jgi:membrane-bound lytic murein transglycosylase B
MAAKSMQPLIGAVGKIRIEIRATDFSKFSTKGARGYNENAVASRGLVQNAPADCRVSRISAGICMKIQSVSVVMLLLAGFMLTTCSTWAEPTEGLKDFSAWVAEFKRDAISQGVPPGTVDAALRNVTPLPHVLELDRRQPESTLSFQQYVSRIVVPDRIALGRKYRIENRTILRSIADRYGVPSKVIIALWAIESGYGRNMGETRVVDSLATLAFDGRRPDFFRAELISALKILAQGRFDADALRGSWAGAMGQVQFMPSTYLQYAVDFDGRGRGQADIWHKRSDVFASAANYLSSLGWKRDESWGREVTLSTRFDSVQLGLPVRHSVSQWSKLGVRKADGGALPESAIEGSVVAPDGVGGRAFLVYDNFRAIMKWNRSTYFALSVGLLADAIGN